MAHQPMKYHECPRCKEQARLLMDIREKEPRRDEDQNLRYHCTKCDLNFSVDTNGRVVRIW